MATDLQVKVYVFALTEQEREQLKRLVEGINMVAFSWTQAAAHMDDAMKQAASSIDMFSAAAAQIQKMLESGVDEEEERRAILDEYTAMEEMYRAGRE